MERRLNHEIAAEVIARGETCAATANDGDPNIGIAIVVFQDVEEFGPHDRRNRISLLRPIQCDAADAVSWRIEFDGFERSQVSAPVCRVNRRVQRGVEAPHRFRNER